MADIFVSYARADQELVRPIVALLEGQGWSVWWDTRIVGGERWDAVIEREITAARCVVVVWTPQSVDREWVHLEAHDGRSRGILVPILNGIDKPPFAFRLIQARNLSGWDGSGKTAVVTQLLADVRQKLEGRIKVDARIVHGVPDGWFRPGAGKAEWFKDYEWGPEMVVVPAGSFTMGSSPSEIATLKQEIPHLGLWHDCEGPQRTVTIRAPFAVGRFTVTLAEWDAAGLALTPDDQGWGRGHRPVINVSWEDAKAYTSRLSQRTGRHYRLLSEAEWEYCCRAGTAAAFWWGQLISTRQANYDGNYTYGGGQKGEPRRRTLPVESFEPNPWGLYQMHGNVWEWCEDNWHDDYNGAPQDASSWAGGDASVRVLRGGSWMDGPECLRSADRLCDRLGSRGSHISFRLARTL